MNVKKDVADAFLDGQCLVAMPSLRGDFFARAVVYLCAHSEEGAMGLILNHPVQGVHLADFLAQLQVMTDEERVALDPTIGRQAVLAGGPVEGTRGFVLHSADYNGGDSTLEIDDAVSMTPTLDILRAIAGNQGPKQAILALGYAGWGAGQLEKEILENSWMVCPADPFLLFDPAHEAKYERALGTIGVDLRFLADEAGHA
jgi:putative transcriptional regulator